MPCCTLLAFFLSQIGIATGALKMRVSGAGAVLRRPGLRVRHWRLAGLGLALEILLAASAAPYLLTATGRAEAAQSLHGAWHVCAAGFHSFVFADR